MKMVNGKNNNYVNSEKLIILTIMIFISVFVYRNFISDEDYSLQKFITFKISTIDKTIFQNNTDDTGKLKDLSFAITSECKNEEFCEINNLYKFVARIPYYTSDKPTKKPIEVIATNSGDCDEKSFLLATLLKDKNYKPLLIFAKQKGIYHTFICLHLNNDKQMRQPNAFLKIEGKKYYYIETTWDKSYIGEFNGYEMRDIVGVYNIEDKKKIALKNIELVKTL